MTIPRPNTVWIYVGTAVHNKHGSCQPSQLHIVKAVSAREVITIGYPFGMGGTWLGSPAQFQKDFEYKCQWNEEACMMVK